jgi:hypothetical protein
MAMGQRLDKIRLAIVRAPATARDVLFNVACKVRNTPRGMAISVCIGAAFTAAIFFYFGGRF